MSDKGRQQTYRSSRTSKLRGTIFVPGDKSISHRALILGSLGIGQTTISGLLESDDIRATIRALRTLGIDITKTHDKQWILHGVGTGGLRESNSVLDLGNSGTGVRLLIGLVSSHPMRTFFTGDCSLSARPMGRIIEPLERMGAQFISRYDGCLPLVVMGCDDPIPITYRLLVPSAQVKSAIMMAGLSVPGITTVSESVATRDHTERLYRHFGIPITIQSSKENNKSSDQTTFISIVGRSGFMGQDVRIPGDISSAAFVIVGSLICPETDVVIRDVGMNPGRIGLLETLAEMGADLDFKNHRDLCGEPIADIHVSSSTLKGVYVGPERAPRMIDEYPILGIAAAYAEGVTTLTGLSELRVKESDRLSSLARGLKACGVQVVESNDSLTIYGKGGSVLGNGLIKVGMDHRIAMSFLVLGMRSHKPVLVDDVSMIETSFPGFIGLMNDLGACIDRR